MEIRIAGTIEESIVDGPGIRYVVLRRVAPITALAAITHKRILLRGEPLLTPTT